MRGARVSVEPMFRGGDGPPLVLLHAALTSWRLWEPSLPFLTPSRGVLAPTLVGHYGGPPWSIDQGWMVEAATDAVVKLLDECGLERPDVVGNSIGGFVALELARRGRAGRVVAIAPMGMYDPSEATAIRRGLIREWRTARLTKGIVGSAMRAPSVRRHALATIAADGTRVPVDLAVHLALATASHRLAMWDTLATNDGALRPIERPEEIDVPVLLVWGDRDRLATRAQMERYQQRLPQAQLVELPGLSHCPQLDDPKRVAQEILAFTDTGLPT